MTESLYSYMRVGLIHFMAYPQVGKGDGPVLETVRKIIEDDYFDAVELTWIHDAEVRKQVAALCETAHISVAYGAQPRLLTTGLNPNSLDKQIRLQAVETLKRGIDEAYELGAEGFAFLSGKYERESREQALDALLQTTQELCEYAKSSGGMKIALEVFDYDVDKCSLIGPSDLAERFAREICKTQDNFGLLVDLSHIPLLHETIEESILPVKDYIIHAHMGNCVASSPNLPAYGDAHPRFGFPGGENDAAELAAYLRLLLDIGFLNKENPPIVSFEVKPWADEESGAVIANAKRTLNRAWAMV